MSGGMGILAILLVWAIPIAAVVIAIMFGRWTYKRTQGETWKKVLFSILTGVGVLTVCGGLVFAGCLAIYSQIG